MSCTINFTRRAAATATARGSRHIATGGRKAIFVAATNEHTGKSSVSMALISGLIRRFGPHRVGYMKPVGQKHVVVKGKDGEGIKVDKDVAVAKEHFGLRGTYNAMSPIVVHKDYTRQYLDGKIDHGDQERLIRDGFQELIESNDFVVVEGTGHGGVGSILGLNNAEVASLLGLDVLLVANGGLGSTFDLLNLNENLFRSKGVNVRFVLLNKVKASKMNMVWSYIEKALMRNSWETCIAGVVPWAETLDQPSVLDLEVMFNTTALAGRNHLLRRFSRFELVTTSLRGLLEKLGDGSLQDATCFVTHASRSDIILGLISHYQDALDGQQQCHPLNSGLILTGTPPRHIPHSFVRDYISRATIPVLSVGLSTTKVMQKLESFTSKMSVKDQLRTMHVIEHYEPHINFDVLLQHTGPPHSQPGR